jgi:competence protein ComEA
MSKTAANTATNTEMITERTTAGILSGKRKSTAFSSPGPANAPGVYPRFMRSFLRRPSFGLGAFALALTLGLSPLPVSTAAFAQDSAQQAQVASVNINRADAQTLAQSLKGVGMSRAQEIVRHRETFGPFASIDELMEVKGVGQSTLDKNRSVLTLE